MDTPRSPQRPATFRTPKSAFGDVDVESVAQLIAAASDIALVVDAEGVIRDLSLGGDGLAGAGCEDWLGRRFVDTVVPSTREKVEELLSAARSHMPRTPRQVNHPTTLGPDIPVLYSAVAIGDTGRVVVVGRDLRSIAVLQRRLVDAQEMMEREYARLRSAETRYRLLFQIASEAVIIIDAQSRRIVETNPAFAGLFEDDERTVIGDGVVQLFAEGSRTALEELLSGARSAGRADDATLTLSNGVQVVASASLFRNDRNSHFLIRLAMPNRAIGMAAAPAKKRMIGLVERMPDAFVVTDPDRRILTVNAAFLELAQLATEEQARGQPLDRWLGRSPVDCSVLVASLREHGAVRRFSTVVRGEYGVGEDVDVSAVTSIEGDQGYLGFSIRPAGPRAEVPLDVSSSLPQSVAQMRELVGRVSLKELVRETVDVIEKMCIEAALDLTKDNRASAAEMLGLSRQSFYQKLHRHGIGDLSDEKTRTD